MNNIKVWQIVLMSSLIAVASGLLGSWYASSKEPSMADFTINQIKSDSADCMSKAQEVFIQNEYKAFKNSVEWAIKNNRNYVRRKPDWHYDCKDGSRIYSNPHTGDFPKKMVKILEREGWDATYWGTLYSGTYKVSW